jgi:predicted peroxiredoxin
VLRARGVGGLAELREACVELGVTLLVCEAGLRAEAIDPGGLMAGVAVAGVARFLGDAGQGQIVSL